jgi:hypothetical protein
MASAINIAATSRAFRLGSKEAQGSWHILAVVGRTQRGEVKKFAL